jgi:RNA polymerase sigma factor (sigma-70 family)
MSKSCKSRQLTRIIEIANDPCSVWMSANLDGEDPSIVYLLQAIRAILESFYSRRMASDRADVEDLVQDTLIAIYQYRDSYDCTRSLRGWLFGIAHHKLIDYFRSQRSHVRLDLDVAEHFLVNEGSESDVATNLDIERLLATLPSKQANVIRDTRITGMTAAESAARWHMGESDVRVSVHRGLKALQRSVSLC